MTTGLAVKMYRVCSAWQVYQNDDWFAYENVQRVQGKADVLE